MRKEITERLKSLEIEEGVQILYACESGSRAWGFASADSDYDVRFVYVREKEWYLCVDYETRRDVVERAVDDLLDINGWDLKKALKLLRKSNPALIEWFNSPIVYYQNDAFTNAFKRLIPEYYSPQACFYHYSHMANGNFREYLQTETVRVKKYFYVLRPLLAMRWIEQNSGVVPVEFEALVDQLVTEPELKRAIQKLTEDKRRGFESVHCRRIEIISEFIETELAKFKDKAGGWAKKKTGVGLLNAFFVGVLNGEYGGYGERSEYAPRGETVIAESPYDPDNRALRS